MVRLSNLCRALALLLPVLSFGSSEEDKRLFEDTEVKAEQGDAEAQYNLGLMYDFGEGVPEDDVVATPVNHLFK